MTRNVELLARVGTCAGILNEDFLALEVCHRRVEQAGEHVRRQRLVILPQSINASVSGSSNDEFIARRAAGAFARERVERSVSREFAFAPPQGFLDQCRRR